jgi:queuosine precursor transporter
MSDRKKNRPAAAALLAVYVGSVVLANWLTTRYGLLGVGLGLTAPAGTFAIGGAIMTRDLLQDAGGRVLVIAAILAGALLSFAVSSHQIAFASGVTFLLAESLEFAVYTPLRRRAGWGTGKWAAVVAVANVTGALADTLIFLHLAGFPVTWPTVGGQMLGKAYVTAAVILAGLAIRRFRRAEGGAGMTGVELIAAERLRQIEVEGHSAAHDYEHKDGELARAGAVYALLAANAGLGLNPWDVVRFWPHGWRRSEDFGNCDPLRALTKAGALIAAEIDRLTGEGP